MAKKLKICLAMGGGVSLGTFSGAALTEALKLLLLYGQDNGGISYDDMEVDGMSGASAGSISLALMMRALIDYRSCDHAKVLEYFGAKLPNELSSKIEERLKRQYGEIPENKLEKIKAIEVAQAIQHIIWVDTLDIDELFKDGGENPEVIKPYGLLSRDKTIASAVDIIFHGIDNINYDPSKTLLSPRALMAFSMANLSPIEYGEKSTGHDSKVYIPPLVKNIQNATSINNHNELRVFDFVLDDDKLQRDSRYLPVNLGNIKSKETWAEIIASCIASGAFPVGFPPAILKRYKEEYSEFDWPHIGKKEEPDVDKNDKVLKDINFAYVDGGTFNNEPIKEAFKMGAFNDFQMDDPLLREKEDRIVFFVDPSVPSGNNVRQLKSLDIFKETKNGENKIKSDLSRLSNVATDLVGMVVSQSEINEEAKIQSFYSSALLNNSLFDYFTKLDKIEPKHVLGKEFLLTAFMNLDKSLKSRHISIGTRDVFLLVNSKYKKLCEEKNVINRIPENVFKTLVNKVSETLENENYDVDILVAQLNSIITNEKELERLCAALFLSISEMALNQHGKDIEAERGGIFPVDDNFIIEPLPGYELSRFAGFASKISRKASFQKGRLDAFRCLATNDFREYHYNTMMGKDYVCHTFIKDDEKAKTIKENLAEWYRKGNDAYKHAYKEDLKKNLKPKITKLISNLFDSVRERKSFISRVGTFFTLVLGSIASPLIIIDNIKKWVINRWGNNDKFFNNLIHMQSNIAIKIRIAPNTTEKIIFSKIGKEVEIIKPQNARLKRITSGQSVLENHDYFKVYLVFVNQLKKLNVAENQFSQYCYLSTDPKVEFSELLNVNDLNSIADTKHFDKIIISRNLTLLSSELVNAMELNFLKLKHGINPAFEIKPDRRIEFIDLSVPLHEEVLEIHNKQLKAKPFITPVQPYYA